MRKLILFYLLVLLLFSILPARADSLLTPYTPTTGCTCLTLGRYPQTSKGKVQPILWRVLRV